MAAFVAAVTAAAVVVLSLGLTRVHPLLAVGLNLVAVGGLAPTVWGWRKLPVWRWFVLGSGVGVSGAGHSLLAMHAVREITQRIGCALDPRLLFFRNLRQLAEVCDARSAAVARSS